MPVAVNGLAVRRRSRPAGHVFSSVAKPKRMHCRNEATRGTISRSRESGRCPWGHPAATGLTKNGQKSKQLVRSGAHLCKEGVTALQN